MKTYKVTCETTGSTTVEFLGHPIYVDFSSVKEIKFENLGDFHKCNSPVLDNYITLRKGITYLIPVDNKTFDSDNALLIKIFSDMKCRIEVEYIKNGMACVTARRDTTLQDKEKLCLITEMEIEEDVR